MLLYESEEKTTSTVATFRYILGNLDVILTGERAQTKLSLSIYGPGEVRKLIPRPWNGRESQNTYPAPFWQIGVAFVH